MSHDKNAQPAAAVAPAPDPKVVDLNDPRALMGLLATMFQQQSESNEINRKLLEIKLREEEARQRKDAEALEKWNRERAAALGELQRKVVNDEHRWNTCAHEDQKGGSTIWPISNQPDGRLCGTCSQCGVPIRPEHYEYDCNGKATLVPEHPLYKKVLQRDMQIYSAFLPVMNY